MSPANLLVGPSVIAEGLRKVYAEGSSRVDALVGLDLSVPQGQFLGVMGPSGSGKSTLLHLLAGLERPTAGSVRIGDTRLDRLDEDEAARFRRRHIGTVFQFFNLIPTLTVEENVALPLLLEGRTLRAVSEKVQVLLAQLGLEQLGARVPSELSGGEMQRVALARAMLVEPELILADEPTGNLDSKAGEEVLGWLRRAPDERGVTLILVTHDLRVASYADRILVMRDGRIEDDVAAGRMGSVRS
jgi:ABC-type lipoprotein export system ATPase subunit